MVEEGISYKTPYAFVKSILTIRLGPDLESRVVEDGEGFFGQEFGGDGEWAEAGRVGELGYLTEA